jgi:hypothetical protein
VLLLARYRFHLSSEDLAAAKRQLLAEDSGVLAFTAEPDAPVWLAPTDAEGLLSARPSGNVSDEQAAEVLSELLGDASGWLPGLTHDADRRAAELLADHRRVRHSSQRRIRGLTVVPQLPADVIGCYVLLPG